MKPGNAAPGSWEPWIDRQDTHSGLKRHEDKEKENQRGRGRERWEMTCFLGFMGTGWGEGFHEERQELSRRKGISLRQVSDKVGFSQRSEFRGSRG